MVWNPVQRGICTSSWVLVLWKQRLTHACLVRPVQFYPGNDQRYVKFLTDIRFSLTETLIRSFERKRLQFHRKLPKTESLRDCMERTIPYFRDNIVPNSVDQGKRVLIASSENAIRGLLMHLLDIPEERISEVCL